MLESTSPRVSSTGPVRCVGAPREGQSSGTLLATPRKRAWALAFVLALALAGAALAPAALAQAPPTPGPEDVDRATRLAETKRLYDAITQNDFDGVKGALLAGADINAQNTFSLTPIDVAVDLGYYKIVFYLLSIRNSQAARAAEERKEAEQLAVAPPTSRAAPSAPGTTAEIPARRAETRAAQPAPIPPPPPETTGGGTPVPSAGFLGFGTGPMPSPAPAPRAQVARRATGPGAPPPAMPPRREDRPPAPPAPQATPAAPRTEATVRPQPPVPPPKASPATRPETPKATPRRSRPGLGTDFALGQRIDSLDSATRERCFASAGDARYRICLVQVRWPATLAPAFNVQSMLYNGLRAYVLYDQGRAVSLYALFRSRAYQLVDAHYSQAFGQPAKRQSYAMTVGYRRQDENRVVTWNVSGQPGEADAVIEIRRFDDARDLYADGFNGVVQVTEKGAPGVFSVLTMLDFIQHKFQRL